MPETIEKQATPPAKLTIKDFQSDQDIRWCPGCGDYSILAQIQRVFPEFKHKKEATTPTQIESRSFETLDAATGLPAGLTISSSGLISGIPTTATQPRADRTTGAR